MSKIRLFADTSGYVDISAPAVADNRNIDLPTVLDSKLDLAGGKILQIVRATDTTRRTTTSITYVDANISVTITPNSASSRIIVLWTFDATAPAGSAAFSRMRAQISDSNNVGLSGASGGLWGNNAQTPTWNHGGVTLLGWNEPATTSAVTYKGRFLAVDIGTTATLKNEGVAGQMIALEISA